MLRSQGVVLDLERRQNLKRGDKLALAGRYLIGRSGECVYVCELFKLYSSPIPGLACVRVYVCCTL